MSDDTMQDHLNNAIYGPPQTRPDERRQYLGSLRERVALRLDNTQMQAPDALKRLDPLLPNFHNAGYHALLNGKLPTTLTGPFMATLTNAQIPFTLVADGTATTDAEGSGLLIVAKEAIDQADIALPPVDTPTDAPKKGGFHLFKDL